MERIMLDIILITGIFYLLQLLTPMLLSFGKVPILHFLSTSNEPINYTEAAERASRAINNFKESLPFFIAMCVLSLIMNVDNSVLAMGWLISRVVYFILGILNVYKYLFIRTTLWFISIGFLVLMGLNLSNF